MKKLLFSVIVIFALIPSLVLANGWSEKPTNRILDETESLSEETIQKLSDITFDVPSENGDIHDYYVIFKDTDSRDELKTYIEQLERRWELDSRDVLVGVSLENGYVVSIDNSYDKIMKDVEQSIVSTLAKSESDDKVSVYVVKEVFQEIKNVRDLYRQMNVYSFIFSVVIGITVGIVVKKAFDKVHYYTANNASMGFSAGILVFLTMYLIATLCLQFWIV